MHTCQDFAKCFINITSNGTKEQDEVWICFDRYVPEPLKSNTRVSCNLGLSAVSYKIIDNTKIGHLEIKEFDRIFNRIP